MDKKSFIEELKLLSNVYGKEMSKEQAATWYMFLKDYSLDDLRIAINRIATTSKYFPSLAEIKQEIAKSKISEISLNAEEEWEKVRQAIRKFDIYDSENALASLKPITRKVLGMTCSWFELCTRPSTDFNWIRKDFISIFNREISKTEKIEMLGSNASHKELTYKEQLLLDEQEDEKQYLLELEEIYE